MDSVPILPRIYTIRREAVMLDSDLALLYGVATRDFNKAFMRNSKRFPDDFVFQLTRQEFTDLMFQIGTSSSHGGRRKLPWVFTEHGALMAATILNSERAVAMSTYVVRAFVKLRREFLADATLEARLAKIEKCLLSHDAALRDLYMKLRPLLLPPPDPAKRRIGFHREEKE